VDILLLEYGAQPPTECIVRQTPNESALPAEAGDHARDVERRTARNGDHRARWIDDQVDESLACDRDHSSGDSGLLTEGIIMFVIVVPRREVTADR